MHEGGRRAFKLKEGSWCTRCHNASQKTKWAQHPLPPTTTLSHPRRRQQRRSRTSRWRQPALLWAVLSRRRRCTARSPLPPTTVSSVLALLLTLILTRTTLLPPARPTRHGNPLMRDSVWVRHPRIAAATPTPYRCRLHHQLLPPQSFLSCPQPVLSCPLSSYILFIDRSTGHPFA